MKKLNLIFIFILACTLPSFADVEFINGDLKTAKERAAREGKLIFIDFWASYCTPCKMMQEYTFTDPSVSEYVNENYIPVKIDVQSFDGIDLKNQFKVALLPTIIVLNSKGVQVGRHEKSMSASTFMETLKTYDRPVNRLRFGNKKDNSLATAENNFDKSKPKRKPATTSTPSVNEPSDAPASPNSATGKFTIQAGAYFTEESMKSAAQEAKQSYASEQRVFVSKKRENGRLVFRILVGNFASKQSATSYMRAKNMNGLVRDFETFK